MQRTFTNFPSGPVGAALFFLRVFVGTSAIAEAVLAIAADHSPWRFVAAIPAALAGLVLLPGLLVPVASALLAAEGVAMLCLARHGALVLFESRMALIEFVVMAATLAVLGAGAMSVDARRFGRREIEIA
ncbi:MAG: hypothetical protein WDO72_20020 [Pseudomonadota bacterium]